MKDKKIFYSVEVIFFSIIILNFIGFFDNAYAFFHDLASQKNGVIEESKKIIESLFNRVNNASNKYQNEIAILNPSLNNNVTKVNKTQEYIDNLKEIISSANKTTVQQDYKPVLSNYIDSLENELESYVHYNKYIITGNLTENQISMDLLSKAFNYETQAINEYKKVELQ
jgi:ribosomal protein S8